MRETITQRKYLESNEKMLSLFTLTSTRFFELYGYSLNLDNLILLISISKPLLCLTSNSILVVFLSDTGFSRPFSLNSVLEPCARLVLALGTTLKLVEVAG